MDRVLFPDLHDLYTDNVIEMQDRMETELQQRLRHVTLQRGVAEGLDATTSTDAVDVAAGYAYNDSGDLITLAAPDSIAVGAGDVNKWVVIENVATNALADAHPITGTSAWRRVTQVATLSLTAAPTADQVKLCLITVVSVGNPPTINTDPANRTLLSLGVSGILGGSVQNPFVVVAADGSGNYTDLASAVTALPSTGGMIFVKEGTYALTAAVVIDKPNVLIQGAGALSRFVIDGLAAGIQVDGSGSGSIEGVQIENLGFDWSSDPGAGDNAAITVAYAAGTKLSDLHIKDTFGITTPHGVVLLEGASDTRVRRVYGENLERILYGNPSAAAQRGIFDVRGTNCKYGVYLEAGCDFSLITDCDVVGNGGVGSYGVYIDAGSDDVVVNACDISAFMIGVYTDAIGTVVTGSVIHQNLSAGVQLFTASVGCVVRANNLRINPITLQDMGTSNSYGDNV